MARLAVSLLGPFQVWLNGEPITRFPTDKERALLAYLATEADRPHRREALAALLWGGMPEEAALSNLRRSLHRLRRTLGDDESPRPFLELASRTVQFNLASDQTVDLREFLEQRTCVETHRHRRAETCETCRGWREAAASLYRGDFLQGFALSDSIEFDEWLAIKREQFRLSGLDIFERLAEQSARRGDYERVRHFALRQIELEPWRETAHRQLMTALARSGQRAAALAQYEACRRVLANELGAEPEEATTALYDSIKTGQYHKAGPELGHNLPLSLTPFFGRETELARLRDRLLDPAERLMTIVGEGGVGKTRLALNAAEAVRHDFADGVWFVPLVGLAGETAVAEDVARAIASALGFKFYGNASPPDQMLNYLRAKECLLVLDNFEHLLEAANLLHEILDKAPKVVMLVTSRQSLEFQAERLIRLEGLPVPAGATALEAQGFSSLRLFAERAERVSNSFVFDSHTTPVVIEICRLVEGLPLGIEMAAALTRAMPPDLVYSAIREHFDALAVSTRDLPTRHRSMRAVFEGSWQRLSIEEQLALAQASVFRGGFTREAAKAVIGPADLAALITKSLLRVSPAGRFDLHELLRQFAAEKLQVLAVEAEQAAASHQTYYLNYVGLRERDLNGLEPEVATHEVRTEIENIQQAWTRAASVMDAASLEGLGRSRWGLASFYGRTGLHREAERVFAAAIAQLETIPQAGMAVTALLSRLHSDQARFLFELGRYDETIAAARKAVAYGQQASAADGEAMGGLRWGQGLWGQAKYLEAREHLEQALVLVRATDLKPIEAEVLRSLGSTVWRLGDIALAQEHYRQSGAVYHQLGDRQNEAKALSNLSIILYGLQKYEEAQANFEQALQSSHEVGDLTLKAIVLNILGLIAKQQGNYGRALEHLEGSLLQSREIASPMNEGTALANLGDALLQLGDYAAARSYYEQALTTFRQMGNRLGECHVMAFLGLLLHTIGQNDLSRVYCADALSIAQAIGAKREQALAFTFLGHALADLDQNAEAATSYENALELWQALGDQSRAMEVRAGLARTALQRGDVKGAYAPVEAILHHLQTNRLDGADQPLRIYLTCYQVLQAAGDVRAGIILKEGQAFLAQRAEKIEPAARRRSFLQNVPAHRQISEAQP